MDPALVLCNLHLLLCVRVFAEAASAVQQSLPGMDHDVLAQQTSMPPQVCSWPIVMHEVWWGRYAIIYWCPLIVSGLLRGLEGEEPNVALVALLSGLPFALTAVFIYFNAHHSRSSGKLPALCKY